MLIHELNIRGIPADDSKTVDQLRSSLRPIIQMEKRKKSLSYPPYNLDFDEEKVYVQGALKKIKSNLKTVAGESAKPKFERCQSHLVHLLNRIDRVPTENLSAENVDCRAALIVDILTTLDNLEQVSRQDPNLSLLLDKTHIDAIEDSDTDTSSVPEATQTSRTRPTPQ